jgi:Rrf2 family iron-sulfur cluster assembly transcriptional regulator
MKVSNKTQYGFRAMAFLANSYEKEGVCSLREISDIEGIPFEFLEKIAVELKNADLIDSKKGSKGGYFLKKNPSEIKIGEILSALDDTSFTFVKCVGKDDEVCPNECNCRVKTIWGKIQKSLDSTLSSITLNDVIKD